MQLLSDPGHGSVIDATDTMYPCRLKVLQAGDQVGDEFSTVYGYVLQGVAHVVAADFDVTLRAGGFFAYPGKGKVSVTGRTVTIQRMGFRGQCAAGRREAKGRLSYIDGCSDSILVYPPRQGDPVFNHLHFPPGILQTQHTHPSVRLGVVAEGAGVAWQQKTTTNEGWEKPLVPGAVFLLEEQELHSFKTGQDHMDVIAFHPDSDWGPTDAGHPMISRTYINHGK